MPLPLTRARCYRLACLDIKEVLWDPTLINVIMARGELLGVFATQEFRKRDGLMKSLEKRIIDTYPRNVLRDIKTGFYSAVRLD